VVLSGFVLRSCATLVMERSVSQCSTPRRRAVERERPFQYRRDPSSK
jgi:hypothetical protein